MPAVLLTILKIIGIVLLSVVALILLVIAIVLFVPIRYRITGDKPQEGDPKAKAVVSFLLHIVHIKAYYEGEAGYVVRIFGIKFLPGKKKEAKRAEKTDKPAVEEPVSVEEASEEEFSVDWNGDTSFAEDNAASTDDDDKRTTTEGSEESPVDITDKLEELISKISSKYDKASEKYTKIRKNIRFWDRMFHDDRNREAVAVIKAQIIKLLKKIAPRSVKGFVHFGSEDPATTGKILMYLALIYPALPKKLTIDPGFEDTDIYGDLKIKGHFSLITPAVCFLKLYFNKDIKRMRRLYKRHSEG